jgi:hypothetical protein
MQLASFDQQFSDSRRLRAPATFQQALNFLLVNEIRTLVGNQGTLPF